MTAEMADALEHLLEFSRVATFDEEDGERDAVGHARAVLERYGHNADSLLRENAALREELKEQWEWNHAEHCSNEWPHPEGARCCWPLPVVLGGDPDAWRPGR